MIPQAGRDRIGERNLEGLNDPDNVTGARTATGLSEHAEVVQRFGIVNDGPHEWTITVIDDLDPFTWVYRWDRLTLYVCDRGSVDLAVAVVRARADVRRHLRELVMDLVDELGLKNRRLFLRPPAGAR